MKKKVFSNIVIMLLILGLSSCYDYNADDYILDNAGIEVKISTENGRLIEGSSRAVFQAKEIRLEESMYRPEIQNRVVAKTGITPEMFILDINNIYLYDPKDKEDPTKGSKRTLQILECDSVGNGWNIPNRINVISSKNLANTVVPQKELNRKWDGLLIDLLPGGQEQTNGMWAGSAFCVKLPDGITRDQISNALGIGDLPENVEHRNDPNYVWVGFQEAIPFVIGHFQYLCFQHKAENVSFINPNHEQIATNFGPVSSEGNPTGIVIPMDQIDFSGKNAPEFVIMFDTDGCLELYDTEDGRYWLSLKKYNPLPFKIVTEEYDSNTVVVSKEQVAVNKPIQCYEYDWTYENKYESLVFVYTRPNISGVDKIRIYSSSNEIFNKEEATVVYEGSNYCYVVPATEENKALHYFVSACGKDGTETEVVKFLFVRANHTKHK